MLYINELFILPHVFGEMSANLNKTISKSFNFVFKSQIVNELKNKLNSFSETSSRYDCDGD